MREANMQLADTKVKDASSTMHASSASGAYPFIAFQLKLPYSLENLSWDMISGMLLQSAARLA